MSDTFPQPAAEVLQALHRGIAIPAHPLALTEARKLDEQRQVALSRYYLSAGAGGLAVAVHTTQFAIRAPEHRLLKPVLQLAQEAARGHVCDVEGRRFPIVMIAGICGATPQAVQEAELAQELGYDAVLLSLAALPRAADEQLLAHAQRVAREIPLVGFYLQPSVGGRVLSYAFWRRLCDIPNVIAIKVAPFNRYQTLDVVRAVAHSGRSAEIALYTGNDDSIVFDLLADYQVVAGQQHVNLQFVGGLLGHWACWTRAAVQLLRRIQSLKASGGSPEAYRDLLHTAHRVTDMNAAIFDAAHNYRGCIAGVHEVLRRQGLLLGNWCLDQSEQLSPGQAEEITRVSRSYPELTDDAFVQQNLQGWLN